MAVIGFGCDNGRDEKNCIEPHANAHISDQLLPVVMKKLSMAAILLHVCLVCVSMAKSILSTAHSNPNVFGLTWCHVVGGR